MTPVRPENCTDAEWQEILASADHANIFAPDDVDLSGHLRSAFGCVEFEDAAMQIVYFLRDGYRNAGIAESRYGNGPGGWGKKIEVHTINSISPSMFAMLCAAGWLENVFFPKGAFQVTKAFIKRLKEHTDKRKSMPTKPAPALATNVEAFMQEARPLAAQCWCDDETAMKVMDTVLCEAVAKRIAAWMSTAAEFSVSVDFYRGLLTQCGEAIGPEAYTSDDGSVQQDVLALKIPEIVRKLVAQTKSWSTGVQKALAVKPGAMRIEEGKLVIPDESGATNRFMSKDYILEALDQREEMRVKIAELERELNWRMVDRFLPEALKRLHAFSLDALKAGDRPRSEAYASAIGIMRSYLGDAAEHERKMNRR